VHDSELEPRQQIRCERVAQRRRLPADPPRDFRLLEVEADRARVDTEQFDLALLTFAGGVTVGGLYLGLEVLREADADRLLGIAARVERSTGGIERPCIRRVDLGAGRKLIADERCDGVPDA
jgi:hypothetical protein